MKVTLSRENANTLFNHIYDKDRQFAINWMYHQWSKAAARDMKRVTWTFDKSDETKVREYAAQAGVKIK